MPITLDGVALENASAPVLFQECKFPLMDIRRYQMPDEVVQNMRTYLGRWGRNTRAPVLKSQVISIDTVTNLADACRLPIISAALTSCTWIAPNQQVVGYEGQTINWSELLDEYCTSNNIAPDRLGTILNADGTLNVGNPYTLNLVRFVMDVLIETEGLTITHSAMIGDEAVKNQFDGLYTQIDYGWEDGSSACDSALNVGNEVNWDTLTGGDGTGVASPDAVTVESTITLWGQSFTVPAGWTLGDFLAYFAEAAQANYGRGRAINWELHAPSGWRMAVLKALSCIKLCGVTPATDAIVSRYERLISGKMAELFGYELTFPIFETHYTGANTLRFGPRDFGGLPTYGLVFTNIVEVLAMLNPLGQALYGSGSGRPSNERESLLARTREQLANQFEAESLHWEFEKVSGLCIRPSIVARPGLLATERHLWLKITGVGVNSFRITHPNDVTVDGVPLNNQPPSVPALSSPANNASVTDTTPDLTWAAVTGALNYDVQVATDVDFGTVVREGIGVTGTTYTPTALELDDYFWRVRARDVDGLSAWSAARKFTVTS